MQPVNRIFYHANDEPGWAPISHLVSLACRLLDAQLCDLSRTEPSRVARLRTVLSAPSKGGTGGDIYILRNPFEIDRLLAHPHFRDRRAFRALWIIDSFWTEALPKPARQVLSRFDLVGYMRQGDAETYRSLCGNRAVFLGWGADVLDLGVESDERPWDVLRVGRQPEAWNDDARTAAACAARGLQFHGRPPFGSTPENQQRELMRDWYARAKFVIAHSNLAAPAPYTHPTKDYVTARWTDALACGAVLAGVQPRGDLALVDWPGAVLDFETVDLDRNLDQLAEAVRIWTPQQAKQNRLQALRRLDWRWRLAELAQRLGIGGADLSAEITRLQAKIAAAELGVALS